MLPEMVSVQPAVASCWHMHMSKKALEHAMAADESVMETGGKEARRVAGDAACAQTIEVVAASQMIVLMRFLCGELVLAHTQHVPQVTVCQVLHELR